MTRLFPVLGDQLTHDLASLRRCRPGIDVIVMAEVAAETGYVRHHKKKLVLILSAMRHFAAELRERGHRVDYVEWTDPDNSGSLTGEVLRAARRHGAQAIVATEAGEYRVEQEMRGWGEACALPVEILADDRFYASRQDFADWAQGRRQWRMEFFYREMRRRFDILLEPDGSPVGGKWNYDVENRKPLAASLFLPAPHAVAPDAITQAVMALVEQHFADHFGDLEPFTYGVTRADALAALRRFVDERLCLFGDYQDAMLRGQPFLYHAQISFYLNCGLLRPRDCVEAALDAYRQGLAPLNSVEGFIRQILGWREFVRGVYWLKMPGYEAENALGATRPLPAFYWGAPTRMACLAEAVADTRRHAYANHIQRLMVLGNFALLIGASPREVQDWYLAVYADAFEWVELPNVSGMVLFADGGAMTSKPYAAGGAYIKRMSDYCTGCAYDPDDKRGPRACPFNHLYWDFMRRHRPALGSNARLAMVYRTYDKMSDEAKRTLEERSRHFLAALDGGAVV